MLKFDHQTGLPMPCASSPGQPEGGSGSSASPGSGSTLDTIMSEIEQLITFLTPFVGALGPGATLAGFTASQILGLVNGLITSEPAVVAAFNAVKAAIDGGAAPTQDQWAALNAAADQAHAALQAEAAKIVNTGQA